MGHNPRVLKSVIKGLRSNMKIDYLNKDYQSLKNRLERFDKFVIEDNLSDNNYCRELHEFGYELLKELDSK